MRSVLPTTPASAGSVFVMRPVALAMLIVGILFGGAMFQCGVGADRVGTRAAGILDDSAAADIEPLVGPGFPDSDDVTCPKYIPDDAGVSNALRFGADCGQASYQARLPSTAAKNVMIGGVDITATTGGTLFVPGEQWGGNLRFEYCLSAGDAGVVISRRSLCSSRP